MKNTYVVLALSITGMHNKTYDKGAKITEDQIYPGHVEQLIANKAIEKVEAPKPPKPPKQD